LKSLQKGVIVSLGKRENRDGMVGRRTKLTKINRTETFSRSRVESKLQTQASRVIEAKKRIKIPERAQQLQKIHHHLRKKASGLTQYRCEDACF